MSLVDLLQQAQNPATQSTAEQQLKSAEDSNFPLYVVELANALANNANPVPARALAGVLLKLALSGQSQYYQQKKNQRWIQMVAPEQRQQCKTATLSTLISPDLDVSRAAAQAVAAMALIELPQKQWPDLIATLTKTANEHENKIASLQALGYICEAVDVDVLAPAEVNQILNSIGNCMTDSSPEKLYLAATTALLNTLEFASQNMSNANERNMILSLIVSATKSKHESVRTKAYECIVRTASNYYEYLGEYMTGLYESTFDAVRKDSEQVGMQALEFWTTLAEEELYLIEEGETEKLGNYIPRVGKQLCELLMGFCLVKQEEDQEEETRNLATAGAMCLGYLSQVLKNDILPLVLPFVEQNIHNEDWHRREAAVLSFGALMDGPQPEAVKAPLVAAFETVLSKMLLSYEKNVMVRDTAAWVVSVVCDRHIGMLDPVKHLDPLVKSLVTGLDDEARVARNVAFAIHNLAKAFLQTADQPTNKLSPLFQHFVSKLLLVTLREDRSEWELAQNAYEAINNLVEAAATDMHPLVMKLLDEILKRLSATLEKVPNTSEEKEERDQLQMFLAGNVQIILLKLQGEICPNGDMTYPDKVIELTLKLLKINNAPCHSDCFMVIGAVANAVNDSFDRYLTHVMPYVLNGLNNHEEYQVCQNAVGTVGDICRAVEGKINPFCEEIVKVLLHNLKDEHLNRDVKPPTLAVFGDIAMAIGPEFSRFLRDCMATVFAAAKTQVNRDDEDMVEYLNTLRENVLEAATGVIQGMNGDAEHGIPSKAGDLQEYSDLLLSIVANISQELAQGSKDISVAVLKGAVGVLGDLCSVLGAPVRDKLLGAKQFVEPLFRACVTDGDQATRETAQWASQVCGLSL